MKHRTHGARLFGLLVVAVLGVMAFAASAQAVVEPGFLIDQKSAVATTVGAEIDPGTVATMLVPGLNFQLTCSALTIDNGNINSALDAIVVILFPGNKCTTLDFTTKAEIPCEVVDITAEALFLPAELAADGKPAVLAEKVKALIKLTKVGDLSKPCTLPQDNVVTGEVCFKITDATNDTVKPLIEAPVTCKNREKLEGISNEVTAGGFPDLVKYGVQDVTLDGKAVLFLTDAKFKTLGVSLF